MKKYIYLLIVGFTMYSCAENPKDKTFTESNIKPNTVEDIETTENSLGNLETSIEDLGTLLNKEGLNQEESSSEEDPLTKLLQMSGGNSTKTTGENSLENMLTSSVMLDLLEASGVSREDMEKLINNPDSLKILANKAMKERESATQNEQVVKGRLSKEQLTSKKTPTGVSLEEAILLVQAESGPEATIAKLKKIDSLAGTNVMEQMDLKEAGYVMGDVERKNEPKANPEEEKKIESIRAISGQMHSENEAKDLLAELEKTQKEIASGKIKASPKFERTIKHQKNTVTIFHNSIVRKSKAAKKKFQELNPDLYFGDEAGETYIGMKNTAVYLPLGKLSFADEIVSVNHPQLMTKQVENVIGAPDKIETFDDVTGIYSLGLGGDLTIRFIDNALTNVNGPDLYIFEIGQIEPTDLEISKDGKKWIKVGKIDGGVAQVDIAEFVKQGELFYFVRLKDLKKKSALPGADVDAIAAIGAAMRLNLDSKVLFDTGNSVLKPAGKEALKELAKSIQLIKSGSVIVEGHTDDVGTNDVNQKLSLARAKSVSAELKKIIPSSTFNWQERGLGESKPIVENDSDTNRARNRRVEILILPYKS